MLCAQNSWKAVMIDAGFDRHEAQAGFPIATTCFAVVSVAPRRHLTSKMRMGGRDGPSGDSCRLLASEPAMGHRARR
jgi:hypothetical protein